MLKNYVLILFSTLFISSFESYGSDSNVHSTNTYTNGINRNMHDMSIHTNDMTRKVHDTSYHASDMDNNMHSMSTYMSNINCKVHDTSGYASDMIRKVHDTSGNNNIYEDYYMKNSHMRNYYNNRNQINNNPFNKQMRNKYIYVPYIPVQYNNCIPQNNNNMFYNYGPCMYQCNDPFMNQRSDPFMYQCDDPFVYQCNDPLVNQRSGPCMTQVNYPLENNNYINKDSFSQLKNQFYYPIVKESNINELNKTLKSIGLKTSKELLMEKNNKTNSNKEDNKNRIIEPNIYNNVNTKCEINSIILTEVTENRDTSQNVNNYSKENVNNEQREYNKCSSNANLTHDNLEKDSNNCSENQIETINTNNIKGEQTNCECNNENQNNNDYTNKDDISNDSVNISNNNSKNNEKIELKNKNNIQDEKSIDVKTNSNKVNSNNDTQGKQKINNDKVNSNNNMQDKQKINSNKVNSNNDTQDKQKINNDKANSNNDTQDKQNEEIIVKSTQNIIKNNEELNQIIINDETNNKKEIDKNINSNKILQTNQNMINDEIVQINTKQQTSNTNLDQNKIVTKKKKKKKKKNNKTDVNIDKKKRDYYFNEAFKIYEKDINNEKKTIDSDINMDLINTNSIIHLSLSPCKNFIKKVAFTQYSTVKDTNIKLLDKFLHYFNCKFTTKNYPSLRNDIGSLAKQIKYKSFSDGVNLVEEKTKYELFSRDAKLITKVIGIILYIQHYNDLIKSKGKNDKILTINNILLSNDENKYFAKNFIEKYFIHSTSKQGIDIELFHIWIKYKILDIVEFNDRKIKDQITNVYNKIANYFNPIMEYENKIVNVWKKCLAEISSNDENYFLTENDKNIILEKFSTYLLIDNYVFMTSEHFIKSKIIIHGDANNPFGINSVNLIKQTIFDIICELIQYLSPDNDITIQELELKLKDSIFKKQNVLLLEECVESISGYNDFITKYESDLPIDFLIKIDKKEQFNKLINYIKDNIKNICDGNLLKILDKYTLDILGK